MEHNPYAAPQILVERLPQRRGWLFRLVRLAVLLIAIFVSGLAGVIGGFVFASAAWPESPYLLLLVGIYAVLGGLVAAVVTGFMVQRMLELLDW